MSDPKTKAAAQGEPSMEEILASIRRIISEDGDPAKAAAPTPAPTPPAPAAPAPAAPVAVAPPAPAPIVPPPAPEPAATDVLELTDIVEETPPAPEPPKPLPMAPAPAPSDDGLVSTTVAAAATGSLASLVSAKRQTERGMSDNPMPLGNAGATIESIVREELRPILKAWLDQNLTPMVERMVQREIQRIARSVD